MRSRVLRLIYPPSLVHEPVLYRLIKNYKVQVNIRQAQISIQEGWLEVELSGEKSEVDMAVAFLYEQGIEVVAVE